MKKMKFLKSFVAMMLAVTIFFGSGVSANANVLGIDVSRYQGTIDWNQVAAAGIPYAMIRVGTTKGGVDVKFHENVTNAQAAGIRTGVYIYSYAHSVEEAINEALLVLQWIENYNINFPVVYDIEEDSQWALGADTITAMCNAFCDVIASAGYHPMVYTSTYYYRKYIKPEFRYDKWIAHYAPACGIADYDIWQFSNTGRIPGINGDVDLDFMATDYRNVIFPYGFVQKEDGVYFYDNYRLQFGWVEAEGLKFHMDALGRLETGWFTDETGVHYLSTQGGYMVTGAANIDGKVYLFSPEGHMQVGWQEVGGLRFYYSPTDGSLVTGWFVDETGCYYLTPLGGYMLTGLHAVENKIYYFNENGQMQVGLQNVDGVTFYFDLQTGTMTTGWLMTPEGQLYFSDIDGHMLKNEIAMIDGMPRCFDAEGKMVVNGSYTIGGITYLCDANGFIIFFQ